MGEMGTFWHDFQVLLCLFGPAPELTPPPSSRRQMDGGRGLQGNGWWLALLVLDPKLVGCGSLGGEMPMCSLHAGQVGRLCPPGLAPLGGGGSVLFLHNLPPGCSGLGVVI